MADTGFGKPIQAWGHLAAGRFAAISTQAIPPKARRNGVIFLYQCQGMQSHMTRPTSSKLSNSINFFKRYFDVS
jgi:hypothetical protein